MKKKKHTVMVVTMASVASSYQKDKNYTKNHSNPDIEIWTSATRSVSDRFSSKVKIGVRAAADSSSYFISHDLI